MNYKPEDQTGATHVSEEMMADGARSLLYSNKTLTPAMISSLMHIQTSFSDTRIHEVSENNASSSSLLYFSAVLFASVGIAILGGVIFLYANNMGPFYSAV